MELSLEQVLNLVGKLDDSEGEDTPRERFRKFLEENVREAGQIRDYVEECLRRTGDQYNRALQDLVNHIGRFLGFEVEFGRYKGAPGVVGFDGYWKSPKNFHIVVEVKTTETYSVKTATVVGYVDQLISGGRIPSWERALGLYVIGRYDPSVRQIENAIVAEKRTHQLRTISVDSLLTLAELLTQFDLHHEDILSIIRPSGPAIDPVVELMARLMAAPPSASTTNAQPKEVPVIESEEGEPSYWLAPVASDKEASAEEVIQTLVGKEKIYAFGDRTPGRREIKPGDWICFYAAGKGVVAHARVATTPQRKPHPAVRHNDRYPWTFRLDKPKLYLDNPVIIDAELRKKLDIFAGRDPDKAWAWLVQATRRLPSKHDFLLLTRQT